MKEIRTESGKRTTSLLMVMVMAVSVFGAGAAAFADETADVIYINGNIYTVDDSFSKASVIATQSGRIVYVGNDLGEAEAYVTGHTKLVDLEGKTVIPGLIDSHLHILMSGDNANTIWPWRVSKADALQMVADEADRFREQGKWLVGMGWNQEAPGWLPDGATLWPSAAELDAAVSDIPVVLKRQCGHTYWVNTKAMEESGLDLSTPEKIAEINASLGEGGEIATDESGNVLVFVRDATELIKIPPLTYDESLAALYALQDECFSYGVTSVMDAGISKEVADMFAEEYEKGDLKLRIYGELAVNKTIYDDKDAFGDIVNSFKIDENGIYSLRAIKLLLDGSLGSGSAAMMENYSDAEEKGYPRFTDEELHEVMKAGVEAGFQISAHAIGDASNRQYINTFEAVLQELGLDAANHDLRPRIEHFQIVDVDDIDKAVGLGIIPSMQFIHAASDIEMAGKRVGPRIAGGYAWKRIIDQGGVIANGTDAPVEAVNPYEGLYAGVTKNNHKTGLGPESYDGYTDETAALWNEQVLSREDALRGYTIWGAFAQYEEGVKGSLEVGKLADFVVIDRDYMTISEDDIRHITAVATVVGGEVVYGDLPYLAVDR